MVDIAHRSYDSERMKTLEHHLTLQGNNQQGWTENRVLCQWPVQRSSQRPFIQTFGLHNSFYKILKYIPTHRRRKISVQVSHYFSALLRFTHKKKKKKIMLLQLTKANRRCPQWKYLAQRLSEFLVWLALPPWVLGDLILQISCTPTGNWSSGLTLEHCWGPEALDQVTWSPVTRETW